MKPHIYFWQGRWWVTRNGRKYGRERGRAFDLLAADRPSFPEACHLAMLAAIHAGVWRA